MGTGGGLVVIDFSEQGNSAYFRGDGWSGQEPDRVWGIGPRSVLRVPLQSSGSPLILEAEFGPCHSPPKITGQIVRLRLNGVAVGSIRLEALSLFRCIIDPVVARPDGLLEIEFECPGFYAPAGLARSADQRPLSCWFSSVRVYTTDMFATGLHFPASQPDIPEIGLAPPLDDASSGLAPDVHTFALPCTAWPAKPDARDNPFTVTEGSSNQFELQAPREPGVYVLRIDARPLASSPTSEATIMLDAMVIGQFSIGESSAWVMALPRELTEKRDVLRLSFCLAKAKIPDGRDTRPNGIAVTRIAILPLPGCLAQSARLRMARPIALSGRFLKDAGSALPATIKAALGTDLPGLLRRFESLGTDPEFGAVQRMLGLDVLNLFSFCEGTLANLIAALTDDMRAAADPDQLIAERDVVTLPAYNLRWPAFVSEVDLNRETSRHANAVTLGYLRRKFYEGLQTGRKIYILKQLRPIAVAEAAVLLIELNRYAPTTLLCVTEAPQGRRPGEVELLLPCLMRGYLKSSARGRDAEAADTEVWLRLLANAALLQNGISPGIAG